MRIARINLSTVTISLICLIWVVCLAGCGGGGSGSGGSGGATATSGDSQTSQTNQPVVPTSLSGKTYSFTVTSNDGLNEPVGSTYSIVFNDGTMFTFNPSPQNAVHTNPLSGVYTFDPNTATVLLTEVGESITGTFNFVTATSGTIHWMEADGEMQDANFMQF
jgi:hypothetical protein